MKKLGIALIFVYILFSIGIIIGPAREIAGIFMLIFLPILMIVASTNLIKNGTDYPMKKLLVVSSSISMLLFILVALIIERIPFLWDASQPTFYIATALLIISASISVLNAFTGKLSFLGSIDTLILLAPVTAFFVFEVYQYNRFTDVNDIYGTDKLTYEISETNQLIYKQLADSGKEVKYLETIALMAEFVEYTAEWSGGYKEGSIGTEFIAPNNHLPPELEVEWITKIHNSLKNDFDFESNEMAKQELIKIGRLFGQSATNGSALEMRLRLYAAQNRLFTLNLIE